MNAKENFPNKALLKSKYELYEDTFSSILGDLEVYIKSQLKLSSMPTLKTRIKNFDSFYKKLLRLHPDAVVSPDSDDIPVLTDTLGIRVICPFLEDLAIVEEQLKTMFNILEIEHKGADRTFSEFGYESIHFLVQIPDEIIKKQKTVPKDLICEIQVRTILQDAWAEVEHELVYKSEFSPFDLPLRRKLASMNASLSLSDIIFQEIRDYQNKLNRELDCRRESFYEKADSISRNLISDFATDIASNPFQAPANRASPYVHSTIDDMILSAIHAHNEGDLETAISIYTQIIEAEPKPNNVVLCVIYKHRGMAKFAMNQFEDALEDFLSSCECDKSSFRSFYYAGIAYSVLENDEKAIEYFTKSVEVNEYQAHAYFRRALTYYHMQNYTKSMSDLRRAISLGLEDEETRGLHNKLLTKLGLDF